MILQIGPWLLLAAGLFALVIASLAHHRGKDSKFPWIWIFGFGASGVGIYGPLLLEQYGKLISRILEMQESPTTETYAGVFDKIGQGELPGEYQELALSYALDRPAPDM